MKVSDINIYIMKIMWRYLKKFVRVVSEINKTALKVQILNEVALIQVVRKRVSFQDRKNENTPKFPNIKKWAFWRYLWIIWVIYNVFIK